MTLETAVASKIWVVALWFAFIFILERWRPKAPPPRTRKRLISNGALWLVVLLISPTIVLPLTAFASGHALWVREGVLAAPLIIVADILILDCWTYWLHRAYHRVPPMWRFHAAHHLDEHLDSTSSLRFHAFEVALSALLRMLPIVLFAIPLAHVVVFETLLLSGAVFHHSNVRLPPPVEQALSFVIVTPSIHWVHHHAKWRDTNSNYSGVFSWWDRLFGTKSRTARTPEMQIGVEGFVDRPFLALLATPFTGAGRPFPRERETRREYPPSDPPSGAPSADS